MSAPEFEWEAIDVYEFWEHITDVVFETHEELLGQNRVAVIEANEISGEHWVHHFDDVDIARMWTRAMEDCTITETGSQFFIVGADVRA